MIHKPETALFFKNTISLFIRYGVIVDQQWEHRLETALVFNNSLLYLLDKVEELTSKGYIGQKLA